MGGNNSKQRRGGNYKAREEGPRSWTKVWPSDEDRGRWGVADPVIDKRAADYISRKKKLISESESPRQAQTQQRQ